jgi:hypothetical protein
MFLKGQVPGRDLTNGMASDMKVTILLQHGLFVDFREDDMLPFLLTSFPNIPCV